MQPSQPQPERYPRRALAAFLFTAVLGPLLGAIPYLLTVVVLGVMRLAEPTPVTLDGVEGFFSMLLMVGMVAYLMGGSQAVIGGALIAYRVLHTGSVGYGFTVLVAVLVALASALYLGVVGGFKADVLSIGMLLLSSAVLAALLGRWLAGLLVLARDR